MTRLHFTGPAAAVLMAASLGACNPATPAKPAIDTGKIADAAGAKQTFTDVPDLHVTLADQAVDVAASGDMAVFRSTYVTTLTDPKTKKPVTDKGNYLAGYKLQSDGSWKQEWSVVSDVGPPPNAAPASPS